MSLQHHRQMKQAVPRSDKVLYLLALISGPYVPTSVTDVLFYFCEDLIAYVEIHLL